jgi:phosphoribosylamine--glycine ligase
VSTQSGSTVAGRKVLVVGSGAREHALGSALAAAGAELLFAPGNAGTAGLGRNHQVPVKDIAGLVALATRESVNLVVVGPEAPLVDGLVDALAGAGIPAFGPSKAAAQLEASKAFMKTFLQKHGIPTAAFRIFDDADAAEAYVRGAGRPLVVKADGLAAGKGVVVASSVEEGVAAVDVMMRQRVFGDAGKRVVIEEILPGEEASYHVVTDGKSYVALAAAQDHKRLGDGDKGPNTGGMGAYAPAPIVTPELEREILRTIIEPTLAGMASDGHPFRGVLFAGLMIDHGVARVLEFNVRFGDPETCVILPLLEGDAFAILEAAAKGDVSAVEAGRKEGACLGVVLAAEGYPGEVTTGDVIEGLDAPLPAGAFVRHAGTTLRGAEGAKAQVLSAGGRVLCVGAAAKTLAEAAKLAYAALAPIRLRGSQHRHDIGWRALKIEAAKG